jgi:hypothetical protein
VASDEKKPGEQLEGRTWVGPGHICPEVASLYCQMQSTKELRTHGVVGVAVVVDWVVLREATEATEATEAAEAADLT